MSTETVIDKDEGLELLLSELKKTIADNRRFLKGLKDESIDVDLQTDPETDQPEDEESEDQFEEL